MVSHHRKLAQACGSLSSNSAYTGCASVMNAQRAAERAADLANTAAAHVGVCLLALDDYTLYHYGCC